MKQPQQLQAGALSVWAKLKLHVVLCSFFLGWALTPAVADKQEVLERNLCEYQSHLGVGASACAF